MTQRRDVSGDGNAPRPVTPADAALIRGLTMSRRSMMAGTGAAGLAAVLAACGTGSTTSSSGTPTAAADLSASQKRLTWDNWALYLDYDDTTKAYPSLEEFTKQTGIAVKYQEAVEDNDTYYGKVQAQLKNGQDTGADIMVLTDWMAARVIRQGYAQKFDLANIPNAANIDPKLKDVDFDKGRNYSLTWQSGYAGLVWDKKEFPQGLTSVEQLWQAKYKGKIEVLSEMRDTIGLIMLQQGVDISAASWGEGEFANGLAELKANLDNGQIRQVKGNSYKEDLISGDMIAGIAWSGDVTQLNAENDDRWGFALPAKGGTLWSDNMLIPIGSPHKKNAEALMNYYYDPAVSAQVAEYVQYICPVPSAKPIVARSTDPDLAALANNSYVFPTAQQLSVAKGFRTLTAAEETKFSSDFQSVLGI